MILITAEKHTPRETQLINSFFEEGLEILHLRKPQWTTPMLYRFFEDIKPIHWPKISIHQQHQMACCYGLTRLHYPAKLRQQKKGNKNSIDSTSTHQMSEFNELDKSYQYAFLSPVHPSISKTNYSSKNDWKAQLQHRKNHSTKLVALGGIKPDNIRHTLDLGFDSVALLGAIWEHENPLKAFKTCQQIALSF